MADYITLLGADDVRSAGHTISRASDEMHSAASYIASALQEHNSMFAETMHRFSNAVALLAEIEGMKAENQHREMCGNSIAYGQDAFIHAMKTWGFAS